MLCYIFLLNCVLLSLSECFLVYEMCYANKAALPSFIAVFQHRRVFDQQEAPLNLIYVTFCH